MFFFCQVSSEKMFSGRDSLAQSTAQRIDALVIVEATAVVLVDVIALLGNVLVFAVASKNRRRLTITDILIIALSLTDLLVALTVMPLSAGALITGVWLYNRWLCLFQGFCVITFACASLNTLSVIAVNRYYCVVKYNDYRRVFSIKRTLGYLILVWLAAFCFSIPPLLFSADDYAFQAGKVLCVYPFEINLAYTVCLDVLFIGVPTATISYCYWHVFRTVQQRNRAVSGKGQELTTRMNVQEANITKTLIVVVIGFALCWFPVLIMDTIDVATGDLILPRQLYLFYTFMVFLSSTINPFIYALVNKRFRKDYWRVLRLLLRRRVTEPTLELSATR